VSCETREDIEHYAKELQKKGARNVLISMAGDGSMLITEDGEVFQMGTCKGKVVNSVGAGDSMVAGFITGYHEKPEDFEHAFFMGVATGSASAFSENLATRAEAEALYKSIRA
jgi:1-phosphofructokinase